MRWNPHKPSIGAGTGWGSAEGEVLGKEGHSGVWKPARNIRLER